MVCRLMFLTKLDFSYDKLPRLEILVVHQNASIPSFIFSTAVSIARSNTIFGRICRVAISNAQRRSSENNVFVWVLFTIVVHHFVRTARYITTLLISADTCENMIARKPKGHSPREHPTDALFSHLLNCNRIIVGIIRLSGHISPIHFGLFIHLTYQEL
ncbi:MAG: hypothetical protein G01um101448_74 [Parcubacteria group bacterium Gr01-1014_48]|nr:MAG: hypothetical protein Greene041614_156 [Parcubacteria group bacterium Greene0416_14]TSC74555.1 MAG: hypothetical protein G01um101448_74 [Parcubacteria group bacterium Gr01-1014_48]TSD01431.1 MAG: hypothetical protein Greene101415_278 [Parcubacteria group bacterium Greene1014_15]TSD08427.1 MAG: hypothetical protein Greene07144_57 [Parcubacteria group bacterium Greene0714_4]